MANYSTEAVLDTAPLVGVPDHVYRALWALTTGNLDDLAAIRSDTAGGSDLRASLVDAGILADVGKMSSERLRVEYEAASGNTVVDGVVADGSGRVLAGPGGEPVVYTDELAREYVADLIAYTDEDMECACFEMDVARYRDGVYIHWAESLGSDCTAVLQWLLRQLPAETLFLRVTGAMTCSKPRPDGFGGFCIVITRDTVEWHHASSAADNSIRVLTGQVTRVVDLWRQLDLDDAGLASSVAMELAAFIESRGLDLDLKYYLQDKYGG